jgi:aldehyde:ferredoxin oxidoreductase
LKEKLGIFEMLNAATGCDFTPDEYMQIGKRVQDLRQAFNLRHGLQPVSVTIPPLLRGRYSRTVI